MIITLKLNSFVKENGLCTVYFNVSHGKSGGAGQVRKRVYKSLSVNPKQFDKKNFRAKPKHENQSVVNETLRKYKEIKLTCETKFDAKQYTVQQVIDHLKEEATIDSVDSYVEFYMKKHKSYQTYKDYSNILKCFKKYLNWDRNRPITFNELSNNTLLNQFKRNMIKNELSPNTINSYFTKIRAILNDAFENDFIFQKFALKKSFRVSKPPPKPSTCSVKEFVLGLEKCESLVEVQALGFWLLMFGTRGMYPADIVQFKTTSLRDTIGKDIIKYSFQDKDINNGEEIEWTETKNFIDDGINKLIETGENFLVHRRHKTRKKSNVEMIIRIDLTTLKLLTYLKLSAILTHYNRSEVLGAFDDRLSIFDYNVDSKTHEYFWDNLSGHCSKKLGYRFMDARKTFNTQALKLKVTSDVRQVLLGQKNITMLQYYDDLSVIEDEVNEAHIDVLKAFEFEALVNLVVSKFDEVDSRISTMLPPYGDYIELLKNKEF